MSKPYKVIVDPGHGGKDPGAISPNGLKEKDITLSISKIFKNYVKEGDYLFRPLLTRKIDRFLSLDERCEIANKSKSDIFISVHCNSFRDPSAKGVEVYHYPTSGRGRILAMNTYQELLTSLIGRDGRGVRAAKFHVLRYTMMPAILVEVGFISNPEEEEFLKDEINQINIAAAIAEAAEFFLEGGNL